MDDLRRTLFTAAGLLAASVAAFGGQRMVRIGDRRLSVYCDGEAARSPTVVLIPAGGRTAKDWATIQPAVSSFTRVCSYDPANFGESDNLVGSHLETASGGPCEALDARGVSARREERALHSARST